MAFALGHKALRSLCEKQDTLLWQRAKLSDVLFSAHELPAYSFISNHVKVHHALPKLETILETFPADFGPIETPEPPSYYLLEVEQRYFHKVLNDANLKADGLLKADKTNWKQSSRVLNDALNAIKKQQYRTSLLDVGQEAPDLVTEAYMSVGLAESMGIIGWPYMDGQGGPLSPGMVISYVGRPALGKTWLTLWTAMKNWMACQQNTLFVSMEMDKLSIAQRIAAMYAKVPVGQLKTSAFATPTLKKFMGSITGMKTEKAKFYVAEGNLSAGVEDVYALAEVLECRVVVIDGAYLLSGDSRLSRFERVAVNANEIKRISGDTGAISFCSWQLNREAEKKKKDGKEVGMEDIGMSDVIPQVSSIIMGLFQSDGVETMKQREISVMKGRSGEIGKFSIAWDFDAMDFSQVDPPTSGSGEEIESELQWVA